MTADGVFYRSPRSCAIRTILIWLEAAVVGNWYDTMPIIFRLVWNPHAGGNMDHVRCIRTMSVRLLVRRLFARGLSVTSAVLGLVTLWLDRPGASHSEFILALVPLVFRSVVWWRLYELCTSREWDHGTLPPRPKYFDFVSFN